MRSSRSSRKSQDVDIDDDEPVVVVKGAGLNVMAVQDAGAHRMLLDEFTYLLSTIRTTTSNNRKAVGSAKEDTNTALLWDLAFLLSKPKNRSILWTYAQDTALPSILKLVGSIPSPAGGDKGEPDLSGSVEGESWDRDSVRSSQRSSDASSMSSSLPNGGDPTKAARRTTPQQLHSLSMSDHEALASIVYFVSLDCTAAKITASDARKMRRAILGHDTAVRGTSHLLLVRETEHASTLTTAAAESTSNDEDGEKQIVDGLPPTITETAKNAAAATSECSFVVSLSTMESHSPTRKKSDPTSSGRRKRRNKKKQTKVTEVISLLDPIAEDQSPSQEQKCPKPQRDPSKVEAERLSFTDSSSLHNENTPVKRNKKATPTNQDAKSLALPNRLAEKVRSKVKWNSSSACDCHDDTTTEGDSRMFVRGVVLEALNRIVQGKEAGEEASCLDGEDDESEDDDEESSNEPNKENNVVDMTSDDDMAKIEASNPLMVTNKLLFESEALPTFAIAMAEALRESLVPSLRKACDACQAHLLRQISGLATLLDGVCLLNHDNREELCANGKLVSSLLQVLLAASKMTDVMNGDSSSSVGAPATNPMLLEIALISVRTLTSLTHENMLAGQQLRSSVAIGGGGGCDDWGGKGEQPMTISTTTTTSGVEILLAVLHCMIKTSNSTSKNDGNDDASKQRYDMIVFCLNTLTNVVETAQVLSTLSGYLAPLSSSTADNADNGSKKGESFLVWLTRWIVGETSSFRDDVLNGTFGKKGAQQEVRKESYLHKDAEEHLVTAGNGFILLACIMVHGEEDVTESILEQTPGGFRLIINTLKSFCNFYYYSVGDLSVAVVAPVKKLIVDLEEKVRNHV
jgi:hypothetical protein